MKTVLVTGGTGFIGRQAVPRLRDQGFEVHLVTHGVRSDPDLPEGAHVHHCDLFDFSQQRSLMDRVRPSHLIHFAWCATPGAFWTSPENLRWVQASLELLKSFAACGGRRTVFAGSCAEYDWSFGTCSEGTTPTAPRSLYGTCKNALRQIFTEYCRQERISGGWGRIFFLYGPHEATSRLIPSVITALLEGRRAPCTHGGQIRDFLHVDEVASAFCAFLASDVEGVVNVASGRGVSIREVVESIADKIGRRDLLDLGALTASATEPPVLLADTHRLAQEIAWRPTFDLSAGLDHAIEWWKSRLGVEHSLQHRIGPADAPGPLSS